MNIYLAGSIRGGRKDVELYHHIILYMQKVGNVLTKYVGDLNMQESVTDKDIFIQDTKWLIEADIIIAKCSTPSYGVDYELAFAESNKKPVHIFYREGVNLSAMLRGNPFFIIHPYANETDIYFE